MEIVSVNELAHYQADMRNVVLMMGKSIGLCGVDQLLYDDGQEGLSPQEAISFLGLQVRCVSCRRAGWAHPAVDL